MDTGALHGFNVGLVISLKQFAALERTRGGVADVALNGKGYKDEIIGK